jgi:hypothetical protein
MAEGLSPAEVGQEIGHHAQHSAHSGPTSRQDRMISISEAVLLSIVTILAAWSGFSAAKWSTDSSLQLAKASAARAKANRAYQESLTVRATDAVMFNAWFSAYLAKHASGMRIAEKRFRPEYDAAFTAWLALHPFTNRNAPAGPQQMPQYHPTGQLEASVFEARADNLYDRGEKAANTGDDYVRVTVILASVLFLVGISTQFPIRGVRYGLISVGATLLILAVIDILTLPGPP